MRRFEETHDKDAILDKIFSYLRGRKQGFNIKIKDEGGNIRTMMFLRRGQENVRVVDPLTQKPELVPIGQVVVE